MKWIERAPKARLVFTSSVGNKCHKDHRVYSLSGVNGLTGAAQSASFLP